MKRFEDHLVELDFTITNPLNEENARVERAMINSINHLAEAVERLEKKVEFIMEHKFSHTTNTIECYKLKDLYQSTQDL